MPNQVSNGLIFGIAGFVALAGTDLLTRGTGTHPIAIIGRLAVPLLAAIAGRRTANGGSSVGIAALTGLMVGAISGLAVALHVMVFGLTGPIPPVSDILSYCILLGLGAGAAAIGAATGARKPG